MITSFIYVHRQRYHFDVPGENSPLDASLFTYGPEDTVEIKIHIILRNPRDPSLCQMAPATSYLVHAGYRRVLLGFLREIRFFSQDGLQAFEFRAQYLTKVLDAFAGELVDIWKRQDIIHHPKMPPIPGPLFRSKVLNPLLQRQLRGVADNDLDAIRSSVGTSREDAWSFYLQLDPLDPTFAQIFLRNILYNSPVHCSLALFSSVATDRDVEAIAASTANLQQHRTQGADWNSCHLSDLEVSVVEKDGLVHMYKTLTDDAVSLRLLICNCVLTIWLRMDVQPIH
jgi:hypothetical protein